MSWFPLSFIEAEKTNFENIENHNFLFFFFSNETNSRNIRRTWTEKVPYVSLPLARCWGCLKMPPPFIVDAEGGPVPVPVSDMLSVPVPDPDPGPRVRVATTTLLLLLLLLLLLVLLVALLLLVESSSSSKKFAFLSWPLLRFSKYLEQDISLCYLQCNKILFTCKILHPTRSCVQQDLEFTKILHEVTKILHAKSWFQEKQLLFIHIAQWN